MLKTFLRAIWMGISVLFSIPLMLVGYSIVLVIGFITGSMREAKETILLSFESAIDSKEYIINWVKTGDYFGLEG